MRTILFGLLFLAQASLAQITIQGTVTKAGSQSAPVAGATLEFRRLEPPGLSGGDTVRIVLGSATTDVNGMYSFNIETGIPLDGPAAAAVPQSFALSDAYPNPFGNATKWEMMTRGAQREYSIAVYNILGQKLTELSQELPLGSYAVHWEGATIPGVYFAAIRGGGTTRVVKLIQMAPHRALSALQITPGMAQPVASAAIRPKTLGAQQTSSALLEVSVKRAGFRTATSAALPYSSQTVNAALVSLGSIFSPARKATLTRSGAHFSELSRSTMTKTEAASAMAEWLKTEPEVEASGASGDGNAWVRYTDGSVMIFVNNAVGDSSTLPAGLVAPRAVRQAAGGAHLQDVPGKNKIVLGNGFGVSFGNAPDFAQRLAEQVGYEGTWTSQVDQLKSGAAQDAGIFYYFGHGGYGVGPTGATEYGIYTATVQSPELDSVYADDLAAGRLVWMYGQHDWETRPGTAIVETCMTKYAFTGDFVREYMRFAPNSLVFIGSCSSAANRAFVDAFFAKGAALFAGFTDTWYSYFMNYCSGIFFDRVLGASAEDLLPEAPPQRSFNGPDVLAWMHSKDLDKGSGDGKSRLILLSASGADKPADPLAPSIATLFVHPYDEKLYLYGSFGKDPGSDGVVSVGGVPMEVYEWGYDAQAQMDKIVCKIPTDGAGSYGDVQVAVRKIKSNTTQLSRYKGEFKLIHETTDGRQYEVKLTLQFRAHLLGFRMKPGENPVFNQNTYVVHADMGSTGESTASGSTAGAITWSGHVTDLHNNIDGGESPKGFICGAWFDPEHFKMQLYLSGGVENGIIQTAGTQSVPMPLIFGTDGFDGKKENFPSYAEIPLSPDFSIAKGSAQAKTVSMYFSMLAPMADKVRIEWGDIACEAKPDVKTKR